MTDKTVKEIHDDYVAALKRTSEIQRRWDTMVTIEPLQPGQEALMVAREQLDLEGEMQRSWEDYIAKRNAYLAAAGFPPPA